MHHLKAENTFSRTGKTQQEFSQAVYENLYFACGSAIQSASDRDVYKALAHTVRDHLVESRNLREGRDQFLVKAIHEILLVRIPREVLERQDCDRSNVRRLDIAESPLEKRLRRQHYQHRNRGRDDNSQHMRPAFDNERCFPTERS